MKKSTRFIGQRSLFAHHLCQSGCSANEGHVRHIHSVAVSISQRVKLAWMGWLVNIHIHIILCVYFAFHSQFVKMFNSPIHLPQMSNIQIGLIRCLSQQRVWLLVWWYISQIMPILFADEFEILIVSHRFFCQNSSQNSPTTLTYYIRVWLMIVHEA